MFELGGTIYICGVLKSHNSARPEYPIQETMKLKRNKQNQDKEKPTHKLKPNQILK